MLPVKEFLTEVVKERKTPDTVLSPEHPVTQPVILLLTPHRRKKENRLENRQVKVEEKVVLEKAKVRKAGKELQEENQTTMMETMAMMADQIDEQRMGSLGSILKMTMNGVFSIP